jgi:hypothetical protein
MTESVAAAPICWRCDSSVTIRADAATVFTLLAEIELWPAVFTHVRWARVLRCSGTMRLVAVGATWRGLPLGWRAVQTVDRGRGVMTLRHVSPLTRGSSAVFAVTDVPREDGAPCTEVRFEQHVAVRLPIFGGLLARRFVGGTVAREQGISLLARLKEIAEGGSLAGRT